METGVPSVLYHQKSKSINDYQQAGVKSKAMGAGLPEVEIPGRPPQHRFAEALKIFPMNLSQLASGIYQFLA